MSSPSEGERKIKGEGGDEEYVRFALVENEHRIKQAVKGIKKVLNR